MSTQTITQTQTTKSIKLNARSPTKSIAPTARLPSHAFMASFVPPASNTRIVTEKELADNCGIGSDSGRAWIAVHGQVFDITDFSKVHPGGPSIRLGAGRDSTCLVESYHPGTSIAKVEAALFHKSTYIGRLQQPIETKTEKAITNSLTPTYERPDDAFFLDVRARVENLINNEMKTTRYAYEWIGTIEAFITLVIYVYSLYQVSFCGSWFWTIVLGVVTGRMGFLMHMGNHCAISRSNRCNQIIGWFMDIIGSNSTIWGYEHQVAHHVDPNEIHHDNDCEIGAPIVRMHPSIPHTPMMKYQHIIIPVAMTVGFFKWYAGDFGHFVNKTVGNVRMAIDSKDWSILLGFKIHWFIIHVLVPLYFVSPGTAILQLFVFMGIAGHYLENIFIVNHIQNGLVPPENAHWSNKQVMASANWKSGSPFWNWVSGGLNHQIEHHMFPALSQYWYPHISPVVRQTCLDHGLTYIDYPNFTTAWIDMFTYLKDMGDVNFVSKTGQKGAPPLAKKTA